MSNEMQIKRKCFMLNLSLYKNTKVNTFLFVKIQLHAYILKPMDLKAIE